jgi:hypothetical protein
MVLGIKSIELLNTDGMAKTGVNNMIDVNLTVRLREDTTKFHTVSAIAPSTVNVEQRSSGSRHGRH